VRIRFVTLAGSDALYCQALLEPKAEITSLRAAVRCYPSAYVSDADRHVLTPTRDLAQGERAELDVANEWWTLYYDSVYDAGHIGPARRGIGPCATLWVPDQAEKVGFTVASYGIETALDLKHTLRDFRFVFLDYAGTKNAAATADLRQRADGLRRELTTFPFTDPSIANGPLAQKQAEVTRELASVPEEKEAAARYGRWGDELSAQLKLVQSGATGTIMAEANAARIIGEWERGLPALKLQALLNEI